MSRKSMLLALAAFLLFVLLTALFWRYQFANMPPLQRDLVGNQLSPGMHIYGDSPRQDTLALQALLAEAQRGNPGAQYMLGLTLEPVNMKAALHWYHAAAAQGEQAAIDRLLELRQRQLAP